MKKKIEKLLNKAFENYDFGSDVTVVAQSGWNDDGSNDYLKVLYVEFEDSESETSEKVSFHVVLDENNELKEAYALLVSSGNVIGVVESFEKITPPEPKYDSKELLTYFKKKYPKHEFGLDTTENLGVTDVFSPEEMTGAPKKLIFFVSNGTSMWDVYCSECSRFRVDPEQEYAIAEDDAKLMLAHNKVSIHGIYDEIMNPKKEKKTTKKKTLI